MLEDAFCRTMKSRRYGTNCLLTCQQEFSLRNKNVHCQFPKDTQIGNFHQFLFVLVRVVTGGSPVIAARPSFCLFRF
jgi:hypothetical protein